MGFLQEIHSHEQTEIIWNNEWGSEITYLHVGDVITDPPDGRFIIANANINDNYSLVNICTTRESTRPSKSYPTNNIKTLSLSNFENIILGGDFIQFLTPSLTKRKVKLKTN